MADYKFPTEMVDLPSKGYFYVEGHPLSKGKVEVKYMTAKEEDILTSKSLIQQGTVIDVLLQSLIVDKSIKIDDMLIGDKNAIMVAARILGYGKEYEFTYDGIEQKTDLSVLEPNSVDLKKFTKGQNRFSFELPNSKRQLEFKLLSGKDEKDIELELKARQKVSKEQSSELTTRLKTMILSVDGNSDKGYIHNFVDNELLAVDSLNLRKFIQDNTPDIDMVVKVTQPDGKEKEVAVILTAQFLWPTL